jgi:hypothetical protein
MTTREQVIQILQHDWLCEENAELKTTVQEKDELVARLRRQLNVANHKLAKLQYSVDPDMYFAALKTSSENPVIP